jgi:integrase
MASRSEGHVEERLWKNGRGYALRFMAYSERRYLTLGLEREGWSFERAEEELKNVLADVRRGIWLAPTRRSRASSRSRSGAAEETPLFAPFARGLVASRKGQVSDDHIAYLEWALAHLLPYFADWPVSEINVEAVDAYRIEKVKEAGALRRAIERGKPMRNARGHKRRPLSAASINKTIKVLQWVLSFAVEYKHLAENPARGKRRRLPEPQCRPVHLDTADQVEALLDAATELDRDPRWHCEDRLAAVATLVLAGPRASEVSFLLWRDIDLANERIFVGRSKTQAGLREIPIGPVLREILATHKARSPRNGPEHLVFCTGTGGRRNKDNLRGRVLAPVLKRADRLLEERGQVPLPKGVTPHKLRHTFASILVACGEDPASVMAQLGHANPMFTLRVYTHLMRRDPAERERLKALVRGKDATSNALPESLEVDARNDAISGCRDPARI